MAITAAVSGCGASQSRPGSHLAGVSIPHMERLSASRFPFCGGFKGTSAPAYCQARGALRTAVDRQRVWKPKGGEAKSGEPSQVVVDVIKYS